MTARRPTLVLTRALPYATMQRAYATYDVRMPGQHSLRDWLPGAVADADALLCLPAQRIDAALIGLLPARLRVIGTFSVGTDHIDLAAARARGIAVVHTPGVLSQATAEFTMGLLLAASRRMGETERLLRAGRWPGWNPGHYLGQEVSGQPIGIFGMGRIGQCLARIASGGFGMQVHYRNRSRLPADQEAGCLYHQDDRSFLAASRFLCLLAPSSPATHGWLNEERLALLPRGAIVVNTARGPLVDDEALAAALACGHVAAAGLDVFVREPHVPDCYLGLENVVLTPHVASATVQTREAMGDLVLDGIGAVLAGMEPGNLVKEAILF